MSTWELLAELPVEIEGYELEGHEVACLSEFVRKTTVIRLRGAGEDGVGEDVTYAVEDQEALQRAGANLPLAGSFTLATFAEHLRALDLFPQPTERGGVSAVPQLGVRLRRARPRAAPGRHDAARGTGARACSRCASSPRCAWASRPSLEPVHAAPGDRTGLRFKLDPTPSWDEQLIAGLVALGAVDSVDLKGQYEGTIVDNPADPELYRRVVEAFPRRLDRGPEADARDRSRSCARTARASPGTRRSTPSRTSRRCRSAAHDQHQALAPWRPAIAAGRLRLLRGATTSAATAVGSRSWASAAARSSISPRCFIPMRLTMSRRGLQPARAVPRTCPPARSTRRRRCWAFAGAELRRARRARHHARLQACYRFRRMTARTQLPSRRSVCEAYRLRSVPLPRRDWSCYDERRRPPSDRGSSPRRPLRAAVRMSC